MATLVRGHRGMGDRNIGGEFGDIGRGLNPQAILIRGIGPGIIVNRSGMLANIHSIGRSRRFEDFDTGGRNTPVGVVTLSGGFCVGTRMSPRGRTLPLRGGHNNLRPPTDSNGLVMGSYGQVLGDGGRATPPFLDREIETRLRFFGGGGGATDDPRVLQYE